MKKIADILKKGMVQISAFFKALTVKKGLILFFSLLLVTIITISFFKVSSNHEFYETESLSYDYTNQTLSQAYNQTLYSELKQTYIENNISDTNIEKTKTTL